MVHWPIDKNSMGHFASHNTTDSGGRDYAVTEDVDEEAVPPTTRAFQDLQRMQSAGKIRLIGVSNFGVEQLKEALATGAKIAVNQICYNLLFRAAEFEVIPFCEAHGIRIICYSPLQQVGARDKHTHAHADTQMHTSLRLFCPRRRAAGAENSTFEISACAFPHTHACTVYMQALLTGRWTSADDVPTYRARSRHFNGERPKSRHGEAGHEELLFATLAKLSTLCESWQVQMSDVAIA